MIKSTNVNTEGNKAGISIKKTGILEPCQTSKLGILGK